MHSFGVERCGDVRNTGQDSKFMQPKADVSQDERSAIFKTDFSNSVNLDRKKAIYARIFPRKGLLREPKYK